MTEIEMIEALISARAHVHRQQFAGKHEQDRQDAKDWLSVYGLDVQDLRSSSIESDVDD